LNGIRCIFVRCLICLLFLSSIWLWIMPLLNPFSCLAQTRDPSSTLDAPANLVAIALDGANVKLTWEENSAGIEGYKLQRAADKIFSRELSDYSLPASAKTFSDNVSPATIYYYRIMAFTRLKDSVWSNVAIVLTPDLLPKAPANLSATSGRAFQVNLIWQDNSNNETGFKIERATDNAFNTDHLVFLSSANVSNCTDSCVPAGTYYYRVAAYNQTDSSDFSNTISVVVGNKTEEDIILVGLETAKVTISGYNILSSPLYVNAKGVTQGQASLSFSDGKGALEMPAGVTMLNSNKKPLVNFGYAQPNIIAQAPSGMVILNAFEFGPSFSTFNPAINFMLNYNKATLPPGQDAEDIQAALWDGTAWQVLNGTLDPIYPRIRVPVNHFCILALLRPELKNPAPFSIADLHVFPQYSNPGEAVIIWATATNNGPHPGNYDFILKLNSAQIETRSISLDVGESATVNFNLANQDPGTYKVDLNGLTASMVVRPTTTETTTSPISTKNPKPSPSDTLTILPTISPEDIQLPPNVRSGFSSGWFNLLLAGLVIIVASSLFMIWKRR
jgi:hypothetical protein